MIQGPTTTSNKIWHTISADKFLSWSRAPRVFARYLECDGIRVKKELFSTSGRGKPKKFELQDQLLSLPTISRPSFGADNRFS